MKNHIWLFLIFFIACENKLTTEQRRKMHEQMELHKIRKVTDSEITEAAYAKGRGIIKAIELAGKDSVYIDSLEKAYQGRLRWIVPGKSNVVAIEQQLIDAYLASESGLAQDNVQKIRRGNEESDSILYTKPVITKLQDGSERLEGIWNIWLSKKELILSMPKK
jgi:hypothetical protein